MPPKTPAQQTNSAANPQSAHRRRDGAARRHRKGSKTSTAASQLAWPAAALLLWTLSSSSLIFVNKQIMVRAHGMLLEQSKEPVAAPSDRASGACKVGDGFRYPLMLTGLGQLVSAIAGWLASFSGYPSLRIGQRPDLAFMGTRLLPVVICQAGSMFFGNFAYLSLSVAFIQILKVMTPAMTLTVCYMAGLEQLTSPLVISVVAISLGTGLATIVEMGASGFSWLGFSSFTFSAFLESVRVVYIQLLLSSRLKYNAVEVLVFLGPPTAAVLLTASFIWEWEGLTKGGGFQLMADNPLLYAVGLLMGFAVNLSTASAISATSSLTFKVFGCLKNTCVVAAGMLLGDQVAGMQICSYAVSIAGFCVYTYAKWQQGQGRTQGTKKVS